MLTHEPLAQLCKVFKRYARPAYAHSTGQEDRNKMVAGQVVAVNKLKSGQTGGFRHEHTRRPKPISCSLATWSYVLQCRKSNVNLFGNGLADVSLKGNKISFSVFSDMTLLTYLCVLSSPPLPPVHAAANFDAQGNHTARSCISEHACCARACRNYKCDRQDMGKLQKNVNEGGFYGWTGAPSGNVKMSWPDLAYQGKPMLSLRWCKNPALGARSVVCYFPARQISCPSLPVSRHFSGMLATVHHGFPLPSTRKKRIPRNSRSWK